MGIEPNIKNKFHIKQMEQCLRMEKMYEKFFKRLIDVILSLIGAIVLLPLFLLIGVAIFIDNSGPIIFKQARVGKDKKIFMLYKFRTMKVDAPDVATHLLENPDQYITRVGKILRKTSLDELPQIYNILFDQMSIIGPRPVIALEEDLITERDKYGVYSIKPGLTGWAQINGRDEIGPILKAKLDAEYMENISFLFDVKCFFGTFLKVLKADGIVEGKVEKQQESRKETVNQ